MTDGASPFSTSYKSLSNNLDNLTVILNKLHAMHAAKIITLKEIADSCGTIQQRMGEWITRRTRRPRGDMAFKLQSFAAKMTLNINRKPALAVKYKAAYTAACVLFPTDGKKE